APQGTAAGPRPGPTHRSHERLDDDGHRPARNARPRDSRGSCDRPPCLGHSPDGRRQDAHFEGVRRARASEGARDARAVKSRTRDPHRSLETARYDRRGTTQTRRRDDIMTGTQTATKTAPAYAIDKAHSEVTFQVRHLLTKVRGRFSDFSGT